MLYSRLPIFSFLSVSRVYLHLRFYSGPLLVFNDTVLCTCIQNNTDELMKYKRFLWLADHQYSEWDICAKLMYTLHGSTDFGGLAVWIFALVIRPHFNVTMNNCDSVLAGNVMSSATPVVACLFCSSMGASCDDIVFKWDSVPFPVIATGAQCSGTILRPMGNILQWSRRYKSLQERHSLMVWTIPTRFRTCKFSICRTRATRPWSLITCFVSALDFSDSRILIQHFQWRFN